MYDPYNPLDPFDESNINLSPDPDEHPEETWKGCIITAILLFILFVFISLAIIISKIIPL